VIKKRSQQGVLIFATPLLLVVLFLFVVLLIDGSRILAVRSEMQAVVNAAATAAADQAQSCGGSYPGYASMKSRALAAARAAGFDGDDSELEIVPGILRPDPQNNNQLKFLPRNPDTQMAQTNAARVSYSRAEPVTNLASDQIIPPIELTVNAAARKELVAILSASGSTATVNGGLLGNVLSAVTGIPNYSLDVTDLDSLANTLVGVGDLVAALGVADLTELVNEPLTDILDAVTSLVGGTLNPVGALVDDLADATGVSGLDGSAVFDVVGSPPESLDASFPAYDFVISVLLNSVRALNLNPSGSGLVAIGLDSTQSDALRALLGAVGVTVTLNLQVDEPPRIVIGPARQDADGNWLTRVNAADITLETGVNVDLGSGALGGVLSALAGVEVNVPLVIRAGGGEAELVGADCARGDSNSVTFDFDADSRVATIQTGTLDSGSGNVDPEPLSVSIDAVSILNFLGLPSLVEVALEADLDIGVVDDKGSAGEHAYQLGPYELYACPGGEECTGSDLSVVGDGIGLDVAVTNTSLSCNGLLPLSLACSRASAVVSGVLAPLTALLNGIVSDVLGSVVSPLLASLGVGLGGMEIRVLGADQLGAQLVENVTFE